MKSLSHRLAGTALAVTALFSASVGSAAAPGPVEDARAKISAMQSQLSLFDQDVREFRDQLNIIRGQVLNARDLIAAGKGNLDSLVLSFVQYAITVKELVIDEDLPAITKDVEELEKTLSSLQGQLNGLCASRQINSDRCLLLLTQLTRIHLYSQSVLIEIGQIASLLEDGDLGESSTDPNTFDDVDDWMGFCVHHQLPNDLEGCDQSLGNAYALLQQIIQDLSWLNTQRKSISRYLVNVQQLLLLTGPPRIRTFGAAMNERGSMQIYSLSGQLVYEDQSLSPDAALERARRDLADGAYLYVAITRRETGEILRREVQKFVVHR